jgi:hypothetical protein
VMVGTMGPIGSGLPQLGFPRLLAMKSAFLPRGNQPPQVRNAPNYMILHVLARIQTEQTPPEDDWTRLDIPRSDPKVL